MRAPLLGLLVAAAAGCGPSVTKSDGGADAAAEVDAATTFDFAGPSDDGAATGQDAAAGVDGGKDGQTSDGAMPDLVPPCLPSPSFAQGAKLIAGVVDSAGAIHLFAFDQTGSWTPLATYTGATYADVVLAPVFLSASPHIATRAVDDTLAAGPLGCEPQPLGATAARPSFAGSDLLFRGGINNDQRLYWAQDNSPSGWRAPVAQKSELTALAPAGVWWGIDSPAAAFTGTDGNLYFAGLDSSGNGVAQQLVGATSNLPPAVFAEPPNNLPLVVFTGMDTNLYWTAERAPADGGLPGWTPPAPLCAGLSSCLIASDHEPVLAGSTVAWIGKDGHVYTSSQAQDGSWAPPLAATPTETTDRPPALSRGASKPVQAALELVYVRAGDGVLRHTRLVGGQWSAPVTVGGMTAASQPALITAL